MKKLTAIVLTAALTGFSAGLFAHDIEAWNSAIPDQPDHVLLRGATVWTAGDDGILEQTDVLLRRGKIHRVGKDLKAPRGAVEIDASGRHITPGLIDAHSHAAVVGGVNEATLISTAMVGIEDVIDADSIHIYRQMAGGLTTMQVMHGSANAIGGRNIILKLRWGADPEGLKVDGQPGVIKFALGENPKQSNWGGAGGRYPDTRPGVAQIIDEKFQQAEQYRRDRDNAQGTVPHRRDIEMEVLLGILDGDIHVHSHGYRADEMLELMRIAERHDFRIQTLQHVLEGYKIADEMAEHGAGGSSFSDWWAYKYEVFDAIPYNGAIMHNRGVLTSFSSDDAELARRMNLEAAKAVRYGGLDEHEALKLVTANPAAQLDLADRIGRVAEGLDADVVLWSGHPLKSSSRVDQTWIDGRLYFDRQRDLEQREAWEAERRRLIELARAGDGGDDNSGGEDEEEAENAGAEDEASASDPDERRRGELVMRRLLGQGASS